MTPNIREWPSMRQLRRFIKVATMAVYSEQTDVDAIARNIAGDGSNAKLLYAYIAIRVAADTKLGTEYPIDKVLEEMCSEEMPWHELEEDADFLELQRAEASVSLSRAELHFHIEKLAPEFSYGGIVYRAEKWWKGPLSPTGRTIAFVILGLSERVTEWARHRGKEDNGCAPHVEDRR
jgi:hypothetical protein